MERNPEKMKAVLRSLARNISTPVSNATIMEDVRNEFASEVSRPTLDDYLNTLEKLFVIENVKATNLNISERTVKNHISNIFRSCLRTYVPRISVSCRLKLRPLQAKSQRYGGLYGMSDVCLFPPFLPILSVAC